jgi:MHS family shikimate/dehydroshikimate transporter-like MFS transporter
MPPRYATFVDALDPEPHTPARKTSRGNVADPQHKPDHLRRVLVASFIGTTIEWYDFFLYGTAAALVFNRLFFPTLDPLAGTLSAYGTFAVGFVARPLGGAIFGHYGDRLGRKQMLIWSLVVMGVATALIGVIPTYDAIGIWSPILLVALRFLQGIGVGGEWGGAVLLAVEHSTAARRGFSGSWAQMGVPGGLLLATAVFAVLSSSLSSSALLSWGWRVPFLLSVVLIAIGLFVRLRILETPSFARVKDERRESRVPLLDVFREHPREIVIGMGMRFAQNVVFYIYTVFVLSYGERTLGYPRPVMLRGVMLASLLGLVAIPLWSHLSDRIGRKPVYLFGVAFSLLIVFPFFWLMERGPGFVALALVLAMNVGHDSMYGPMAAYLSELFGARVRYTGASLVYQLTSVFSGGVAPFIATVLLARYGSRSVAAYVAECCVITAIAGSLAPETNRAQLDAAVSSLPGGGHASRTNGSG